MAALSYKCSECGRPIGLLLDRDNRPTTYYCPHAKRHARAQEPIYREALHRNGGVQEQR